MIHFDEASHTYTLDGRVLPSVTQILAPLSALEYRGVAADVMERAAALGRATHKAIELDVSGTLDESTLDDIVRPYFAQWQQFRALSGFVPLMSEARVYSERYGYAGTLDLFGELGGALCIIDAKRTAMVPRLAGPQTAGYAKALADQDTPYSVALANRGCRRYALHLAPAGWKLIPFTDPNDLRVFLSALTIKQWSDAA